MATVLILGSNSFAGATFSRTCLDAGFDVIGTSRSDQVPFHRRPYAWGQINRDIRFEKLDLNDDFEGVCSLVDAIRPEYVADFAAQGMVAPSWKHPEQWYQTNITAKVRLHNYLKDKDYLRCYLRISTPEVYGNTSGAVSPEHSLNPSTPYAVSHAAIDMSLMAF
ncbi:MAG: SDR family oxidoreductase, partial [Pseudomonadota bacterium]